MGLKDRYKKLTYEQKIIAYTVIGICFSALLAAGKLVIGALSDYTLCGVAIYSFAFILSKLECVLGVKSDKRTFKQRNFLIFILLLISSICYIGFNCRVFFTERKVTNYGLGYALGVAFISFMELGFAIAGLFRTKNKGYFYRDIKIINFGLALTAILTTQITLLDFNSTAADYLNAWSGIGVGCFIAVCSVYILLAPVLSVIGREKNDFALAEPDKNKITDGDKIEILLCKSSVYGSYVYRAAVIGGVACGEIGRTPSLWKRMPVVLKVFCCILSEILIFAWLAGRLVLFVRSACLPQRLEKIMNGNGFVKITTTK